MSPATAAPTRENVLYEKKGAIAYVTLNRPKVLNALNKATIAELNEVFKDARDDAAVRGVILTGAGDKAFAAGADIAEMANDTPAEAEDKTRHGQRLTKVIENLGKPVVAAVNGFALGGGCELALSCDLVVADETATFGLPEVTVGLVPGGGGTQLALRRLGPGRAADMVLTGRKVGIDEAMRFGLVDRRVPAGQADRAALDLAGQIAANSPVAVRAAKRAIRHGWGVSLEAGLDIEDAAWRTAALSADRREGIAAFVEKRKPAWPGQ
jgi:enoyl-CoA hydratase/carnithine racemase